VLILGVPADRIRAIGESWSDGGLWDDVLFLAELASEPADDGERRMRWHHLVMAAGNFKRQNGRRLRPSRLSPASFALTARAEHFRGPDGLTVSRDDARSWQHLQNSLDGAGAVMTTTLLAAWAAPAKSIQTGASATLMVRRARRPWSVLTAEVAGMAAQGSFLSCLCKVGMLPLTVMT
jgi:hypothetical protein